MAENGKRMELSTILGARSSTKAARRGKRTEFSAGVALGTSTRMRERDDNMAYNFCWCPLPLGFRCIIWQLVMVGKSC